MSMYPFSILTDEHGCTRKISYDKKFIMINHRYMAFENNLH